MTEGLKVCVAAGPGGFGLGRDTTTGGFGGGSGVAITGKGAVFEAVTGSGIGRTTAVRVAVGAGGSLTTGSAVVTGPEPRPLPGVSV